MDRHRKRHCWECRRLCLVCDFTEPACRRCFLSGIECPGYSDVKPTKFKWLIPGRITSRHRVRKRTASDVMDNNRNEMKTTRTTKLATTKKGLLIPQFEILTEAHIIGQAAQYFNSCIYQDLLPIQELGPNPHIYPISATHLKVAATRPDYLLFGMICMTLSHRINRTRSESSSKALAQKFYLYWGLSVRSLNRRLDVKDGQLDDLVLVSVMTLLLTDVQMGTSLNWRCHLDGLHKMIALRGGYKVLATSWSLEPLLICLWFVAVIANTTCPASDLTMTSSQLDEIEFLQKQYSDAASPFMMCPFTLFAQIIKINHLRMRATACETKEINDLSQEAYNILERIHDFSPEEWANSKFSSKADWLLIGKVYQASIVLYCILSLQSLSVLPTTALLQASCSAHGRHLHLLLDQGLASQKIKRFMIWPLVLLGVQAIHEDLATRAFVSKQLPELSRDVGTYVPLMAKRVLESFWGSGKTDWDACFDRPFMKHGSERVSEVKMAPTDQRSMGRCKTLQENRRKLLVILRYPLMMRIQFLQLNRLRQPCLKPLPLSSLFNQQSEGLPVVILHLSLVLTKHPQPRTIPTPCSIWILTQLLKPRAQPLPPTQNPKRRHIHRLLHQRPLILPLHLLATLLPPKQNPKRQHIPHLLHHRPLILVLRPHELRPIPRERNPIIRRQVPARIPDIPQYRVKQHQRRFEDIKKDLISDYRTQCPPFIDVGDINLRIPRMFHQSVYTPYQDERHTHIQRKQQRIHRRDLDPFPLAP